MNPALIVIIVIAVLLVALLVRTVRTVPQATAGIVERFGRYHRTLSAGMNLVVPFIDRLRPLVDLREQVVSFPPQPITTSDNAVVSVDTVVYFQVTDAKAATYETGNFITAMEQLTITTLLDVIGRMDLNQTLTSREEINRSLRQALGADTARWGIKVNRVELKTVDPPPAMREAMDKEMQADRDKNAAIAEAEGEKQAAIRSAEGEKQAAILRAEGDAEAQAVRARGQSQALATLGQAIQQENPDHRLLAFQYVQMLPQIAEGSANTVWVVPSEMGRALEGLGDVFGKMQDGQRGTRSQGNGFPDPSTVE